MVNFVLRFLEWVRTIGGVCVQVVIPGLRLTGPHENWDFWI